MASAIIHLCVAKKINNYLQMDERTLSLGAIAPDIAKQIGEPKNKSHFMKENDSEDCFPDCDSFVKKYRSELDKPFEMGYLIHLLTDYYWFKYYIKRYISNYSKDKDITYTAIKSLIYNDYTRLNQRLIDDYMLDLYFFCNEITLPESKITEIPMDKLQIIIDKMSIIIQSSKNSKLVLMNEDEIIDFIEHISNVIIDDLNKYGLIKEKIWKKD